MELHALGFHPPLHTTSDTDNDTSPIISTPEQAQEIRILWTSWCDMVIALRDSQNTWRIEYRGLGLTAAQKSQISQSQGLQKGISGPAGHVHFFGSTMHDGLRGYVYKASHTSSSEVVLFASDSEIDAGHAAVQVFTINSAYTISNVRIASNGNVLVSSVDITTSALPHTKISRTKDFASLRTHLASTPPFPRDPADQHLPPFPAPTRWASNATTATLLVQNGRVFTSTADPRYPKCLGRPWEGKETFESVAYLSETMIVKVVSGGYMTAAVSSDGEPFLWGQACPGASGELDVLGCGEERVTSGVDVKGTGITVEKDQDEWVKCLTVKIDGEEARVYDVAIGTGHVLVAAEISGAGKRVRRAVFAAGDNARGQLGLGRQREYVKEFAEVLEWRDRKVVSLHAAGWSTFVVLDQQ